MDRPARAGPFSCPALRDNAVSDAHPPRPPINHLVILRPPYLDMILSGEKTVESRLSRRRHPAATRCAPGDILYLKGTGGDIEGRATVLRIDAYEGLTREGLRALAETWAGRVAATERDDWYQRMKQDATHALFFTLGDVVRIHIPRAALPRSLPWASAWIVGQPVDHIVRAFVQHSPGMPAVEPRDSPERQR